MQEQTHPLIDQERFIRDLLAAYKGQPVLWDKNHRHYRNRSERYEAHEVILHKCREYYPEADEDFVKIKIDSLRATFRKEWNKVCSSKASAERPEDVYKPSLWYYSLLLYTVGEECSEEDNKSVDTRIFWSRECTTILIGLLKKHPCLYINSPVATLAKRNAAIKRITDELNAYAGNTYTSNNIRKKIQLLKGQYRFECKKIKERRKNNPKMLFKSNLWCFDMLSFLKGHVFKKGSLLKNDCRKSVRRNCRVQTEHTIHSEAEKVQTIKEEEEEEAESELNDNSYQNYVDEDGSTPKDDYDDIFDTIGKNVARKLRDMTDDQRKYAERLVNEVMYHGLMEGLTCDSRLSLDVT